MPAPLQGVRIVDLTTGVAGPYATKLLADHGADVIKIEPPGGDPARFDGPFFQGRPHIEGSGRFLFLNTNKRSVVLDLGVQPDRERLRSLIGQWSAQAVVEDLPPGSLDALDLGYATLGAVRPGVVLTSITPWGQSGPYLDYRISDIVAQAMGGPMLWTGHPGREPLRLGGGAALALYHAGAAAALATTMALYRQLHTGEGDHIDVSIYETQIGSRDRAMPHLLDHIYNGMEPRRQGTGAALATGIRPCLDGYVNMTVREARLPTFLHMIGRPDLADDPAVVASARTPAFVEAVETAHFTWLLSHTKAEAADIAQAHGLPAAPINTIAELLDDQAFRDRGAWETIDHPYTGPIEYPGRPFILPASPRPAARRAPFLGEHDGEAPDPNNGELAKQREPAETGAHSSAAERALGEAPRSIGAQSPPRFVRSGAGSPADHAAPIRSSPLLGAGAAKQSATLPLAGVRVADITVVWAGPSVTQFLAEWGAEVIRVEPVSRIQPTTRYAERVRTRELELELARLGMATGGGYPNHEPGERPWDRNSSFNSHARNKRSMACDIMTEEGRASFLELIATSDVFVENNVPSTIDKARITYDVLKEVRPDLVMLRMPGAGLSGPYRNYRGFGTHLEALVGHHFSRGYPDGSPDESGDAFTADAVGGLHGALAVLLALYHRARTGEGQQIELAQAESFLPMLAELILDWTMNKQDLGPWGNRHRSHAPHGAYRCAGEDQWIAIDVGTDAEFAALCSILACDALAADARFATTTLRLANRDALDVQINQLTRTHDKSALFRQLQAELVTAGPLQSAAERLACPQLNARGYFEYLENDVSGRHLYPGLIWRMANTPNHLRRAPVTLGQDNEPIYRGLLGMAEAEYERLRRAGLIGTTYHLTGQR